MTKMKNKKELDYLKKWIALKSENTKNHIE